jgi:serine/threonine-protein kinase
VGTTAVFIAGILLLSINSVMVSLLHARKEVVVPNLEGKSLLDALAIVSQADLALQQDAVEYDESLPAGTVVRQHPPSGMQVRSGRGIRVVVSKGGQVFFVPNVIGRPLAEAQSVMAADRLQMGAVTDIYSVDVPKGVVIDQHPSSGTVVTRGALVDVQVSKGLPPAGVPLVPDFIGQSIEDAEEWAEGVSASLDTTEDAGGVGPAGTVVKQTPAGGQPLLEGEKLRLSIVPRKAGSGTNRFAYQIPGGEGEVVVRIMARDARGENQVYEGRHAAGELIEIPVAITSTTRLRIYLDDVLKEEKVIEP